MTEIEMMNSYIQQWKDRMDVNQISDGYHTFGELYEHRIELFISLCRWKRLIEVIDSSGVYIGVPQFSSDVWKSRRHSDGELAFGGKWFVLGMFYEKGKQITYHLPEDYWSRCLFATELEKAPEWDGHTSNDVIERLKLL